MFTNGCFDIIHRGHLELLKYCKTLGYVVVGLNSDDSVKRLKGQERPINNQSDRKHLLECLKFVDEVVVFNEDTPINLINQIQPDVIVKGGDYKAEEVIGSNVCEVKIFNYVNGYSTTQTIERINNR